MKRLLLLAALGFSFAGNAQVTVFEDGFENYPDFAITGFGNWLSLDFDGLPTYVGGTDDAEWDNAGDPQAFMIFNPVNALVSNSTEAQTGENANFDPHTGQKYAACWNSVPSGINGNNDWLVSPQIDLTNATGAALSVWVKSLSDTYELEKYRIGVYTGSGVPASAADFTIISGAANLSPGWANWEERTQSLAAYDGQVIRVGIQCRSFDNYMFMVDDFKITATSLSVSDNLATAFNMVPNPATDKVQIRATQGALLTNVEVVDLNGRTVMSAKATAGDFHQLNIAELSAGMYMVNIISDQGSVSKKLIKR
jgi:hypothetical protein